MNLKIIRYGDDLLHEEAREVQNITDAEIQLVQNMVETMYKAPGVGLAAPQVGVSKRIMVTDTSVGESDNNLLVLINPKIVSTDGEQYEEEGCLSIPGFSERVVRPKKVIIQGLDMDAREVLLEGSDLLARAFCHEMDHLNGVLFLDHLSFIKRDLIRRKIKKLIKQDEW